MKKEATHYQKLDTAIYNYQGGGNEMCLECKHQTSVNKCKYK